MSPLRLTLSTLVIFTCNKIKDFCHPELVSGSFQMLKQVQHDIIIVFVTRLSAITYQTNLNWKNIPNNAPVKFALQISTSLWYGFAITRQIHRLPCVAHTPVLAQFFQQKTNFAWKNYRLYSLCNFQCTIQCFQAPVKSKISTSPSLCSTSKLIVLPFPHRLAHWKKDIISNIQFKILMVKYCF